MSNAFTLTPDHLVSVIVRTKDRPRLLQETLKSIIEQLHRPIEVVLVNDGGSDVFEIADSMLGSVPDIALKYISNKSSAGRSKAANYGLNAASGAFSLFLDDDDVLETTHISQLLAAHLENFPNGQLGASHCVAKAMLFDEQGNGTLLSYQGEAVTLERLLYQNCLPIMTVLFSTKVREFAQFDEQFDLFEDWDFWLQLIQRCSFHFVDQSSCIYRMHSHASSVRAQTAAQAAYQQVYQKWLTQYPTNILSQILSFSHSLHEAKISSLQSINQAELNRIGALHAQALSVIEQKDSDIHKLTTEYEHAIGVIAEKDEELRQLNETYAHAIRTIDQKDIDIDKLSSLHQQALDVIDQKDEDIAHLSTLHSEAQTVIAQKDRDTEGLASLYDEATDHIAKLEQLLSEQNNVTRQLEQDIKHYQESSLKPWYWHLYQGLKRKKY